MKKTFYLVIALVLVFALTGSAQVPSKPFNIYAGGGLTAPSAPDLFKDTHKNGFHATAGLGFNAYPFIQLVGKVEYHTMSMDWDEIRTLDALIDAGTEGGKKNIWMYGVDARFSLGAPGAPFKPFGLAGVGFASISQSDITTVLNPADVEAYDFDNETKFYFNLGGGIEFQAAPMITLFLQGRYVNIKQDGDNLIMIPITLGIKL